MSKVRTGKRKPKKSIERSSFNNDHVPLVHEEITFDH